MKSLTKVQFFTLVSLTRFPMHIYAIRQEIIELTDHTYYPRHSTVRRAVDSLLKANLIEECWSNPHYWLKARRGAPYELTKRGRWRAERELAMYFRLCQVARIWRQSEETVNWSYDKNQ